MSGVNHCPGAEILRQFLLGQLSEQQVESLTPHLETCPECALTLQVRNITGTELELEMIEADLPDWGQ